MIASLINTKPEFFEFDENHEIEYLLVAQETCFEKFKTTNSGWVRVIETL
jgi:hypothetical protein